MFDPYIGIDVPYAWTNFDVDSLNYYFVHN